MDFFATQYFLSQLQKLRKIKSYKDIDNFLADNFVNVSVNTIKMKGTTNLNGLKVRPYLKKILGGKGGYRIYFIVVDDVQVIFVALSAKKGSRAVDFSKQQWTMFYRKAVESISDRSIQEVIFDEKKLMITIKEEE